VECLENAQLRGNTEYLATLAPDLSNADPVDRNCQLGSAVLLTVSSDVHEHNAVSDPDAVSSPANDESLGELTVVNGVSVNSCENLVVAPKVPDTRDSSLRNTDVTGKSSADISNVDRLDSSVNKLSCSTQDGSSFNVCQSQENPLQCLHDTFIAIRANQGDLSPRTVGAATDVTRIKTAGAVASSVTLENY
jgi:hypothetical protein